MHGILERSIDKHVVVRSSHLQETLAALDVLHQVGRIPPDAVRRTHVDRCIEFPSRPLCCAWCIGSAMEQHVVDACHEHQVKVGFHLRERCTEMFGEPGKGLARRECLTCDMGCRRGILQRGEVAVVLTDETFVGTQSLNLEVSQSEAFYLGDVDGSVEVYQVAG